MILVLVETAADAVTTLSAEALTLARMTGEPLHAAVVGEMQPPVVDALATQGIEVVHELRGPGLGSLDGFAPAARAAALARLVASAEPALVLAAGSPRGTEVMAHLAARLGVPLAAGCVLLTPGEPWTATRQLMGGAVLEELTLPDGIRLATMAPHAVQPSPAPTATTPEVRTVAVETADTDLVVRVVAVESDADGGGALADARVVVGGGRGVGGPDAFDPLLELAGLLHGTLGVSRVVTSQGWRPHHEQVGQTGTKIAPDLYVACGISGAIQHMAGCLSAKTILAINTDAGAPMVTRAHYAVIGDLHEVVPAVNAELRRRLA